MIAYRMQDQSRDVADLLDPEQQWSYPMDGGDDDAVRRGISGVETLAGLAAYLACYAIQADVPVLVRIEGPESEDAPCDADAGEVLLLPTSAVVVEDDETFFDVVGQLCDAYWEDGVTDVDDLTEMAEDLGL
nr:MAG TPA: hypothetical protein [Caudoviricetes sp.]